MLTLCVLHQLLLFSSSGTPGHFELKTHIFRKNGSKSLKLSSSDLPLAVALKYSRALVTPVM